MANRGLSDDEIGLIKGMIALQMPAQDICGYMFRPGRSLNPAGVYEIRSGKCGGSIPARSEADVVDYIANHPYFGSMATVDRIAELRKELRGMLRLQKTATRSLAEPKEAGRLEFKETFHIKSLPEYARSLIGYSNNCGGFIVFGIRNDQSVVGLKGDTFRKMDPQKFSQFLKDSVHPSIPWGSFQFTFNDFEIGCLYAEESNNKPHMTVKNADSLKGHQIYYRYEGETATIRAGELFNIIREREGNAIQHAISKLQQIAGIGIDEAFVSNVNPIDREFNAEKIIIEKEIFKKSSLNDNDVLSDFIEGSLQARPEAYIEQSAHESVRWLPLFYFMREGNLSPADVAAILSSSKIAKPGSSNHIRDRISGKQSAFKSYLGGGPQHFLDQLIAGTIPKTSKLADARHMASCLIGLQELGGFNASFLRAALSQIIYDFERFDRDSAIGSNMRRSASRVDELLYGAAFVGK